MNKKIKKQQIDKILKRLEDEAGSSGYDLKYVAISAPEIILRPYVPFARQKKKDLNYLLKDNIR